VEAAELVEDELLEVDDVDVVELEAESFFAAAL